MASPSVSAFTPEVKELILKRAQFRCDRCGLRAEHGHFHHRNPRRMGGSGDDRLGLPSNGLLLHPNCHDYIESKRKIAAELGFILGYDKNPSMWPVYLWNGWHYLNEDGTVTALPGPPEFPIRERPADPAGGA